MFIFILKKHVILAHYLIACNKSCSISVKLSSCAISMQLLKNCLIFEFQKYF